MPHDSGQSSVELLALMPALALCGLLAWQALRVGETWWLTSTTARDAARAHALGSDPRFALPPALRGTASLTVSGNTITLKVPLPRVAGLSLGSASARASMEPQR
jgi:pilus assembly protein CpaE